MKKLLDSVTWEVLENLDFISYICNNKENKTFIVIDGTNDMKEFEEYLKENNLYCENVAFADSVNVCPCCGYLYFIEDIIQLEDDIICKNC